MTIRYPAPNRGPDRPGLFPLRPQSVGEILTSSVRVAWRYLGVLLPGALLINVLTSAVYLGVLAAFDDLDVVSGTKFTNPPSVVTQAYLDDVLRSLGHLLLATSGIALVSLIAAPVLAGLAGSVTATAAVQQRRDVPAVLARMRGRWPFLLAAAALAGLATFGGLILFVVPGILLWLALLATGPVAVLEGATPRAALQRAARLTRSFRGRIFGILLLGQLFSVLASFAVGILLSGVGTSDSVLTAQAISAVVGSFTSSWLAVVTAMIYVDIRIRTEGLAEALLRSVPSSGPRTI